MSRPYGGHHEARQALQELDEAHTREMAESWLADLEAQGHGPDRLRRVRDNLQRRLDAGEAVAGLPLAAMAHVVKVLTYRLGG